MMPESWKLAVLLGLLVVLAFPVTVTVQAQGLDTIPQDIARGSSGRIATAPSGRPPTITEILRDTDVVVRGILTEPRSYLSADQRNVFTEYTLRDAVVLYQAEVFTAATPGAVPPPLTVAVLGGTITFDGRTFTQTELGLPLPESGMEGLLLLQRVNDQYHLVGRYWGAFIVSEDRLTPLTTREGFVPEYRNVPAAEATADIVSRLQALRQ